MLFIYGPDTYSSQQYLNSLLSQYKTEGREVHVFREEAEWEQIALFLSGSGLFGAKKKVVIKNCLDNKNIREPLAEYLATRTIDADVILVIYQAGAIDKRLGFVKKLLEKAESKEFLLPELYAVEERIKKWITEAGKKIEPNAARYLAQTVGADLWRARSEVDKLVNLAEPVITLVAVGGLAAGNLNDDIWQFVDAVGNGRKIQALQLLEQQFLSGSEPLYLLSMVIREVRLMLALSGSRESDNELAAALALHPYVVKKTRQRTSNVSVLRLKGMYQALVRLDAALKSGRGEPRLLFTVLLDSILK